MISHPSLKLKTPDIALILRDILDTAFKEDIGFGDITSSSVLPDQLRTGVFIAKMDGVLSGTGAIEDGYRMLNASVDVQLQKRDGDRVQAGDQIAEAKGPVGVLLTGERVILNILQHLSGIATQTAKVVNAMKGSNTRICDTRKTLPGLRALQKYAVRCGGGYNHRLRLDDGVIIKDNHIKAAGGIREAVEMVLEQIGLMVNIEVECENEHQVREAIEAGADIIMLDNRTPEEATELCRLIPDNIIVELSGGISVETAKKYAYCGADYISIGALTHSVKALDISFNLLTDQDL